MPLVGYSLEEMKVLLNDHTISKGQIALFSCPDLMVHVSFIEKLFPDTMGRHVIRPDSGEIIRWHKAEAWMSGQVIDTHNFFETVGWEPTSFDIVKARGCETIRDLSQPIDNRYNSQFDLVFDCISNQVFEIAQCMVNALAMVKVGGYIVHVLPVTMVNQGFYSVSPTLFHDFYSVHDCEVVKHRLIRGVYQHLEEIPLSIQRYRGLPDDVMNLVIVKKVGEFKGRNPVMMKKFIDHPTSKRFL